MPRFQHCCLTRLRSASCPQFDWCLFCAASTSWIFRRTRRMTSCGTCCYSPARSAQRDSDSPNVACRLEAPAASACAPGSTLRCKLCSCCHGLFFLVTNSRSFLRLQQETGSSWFGRLKKLWGSCQFDLLGILCVAFVALGISCSNFKTWNLLVVSLRVVICAPDSVLGVVPVGACAFHCLLSFCRYLFAHSFTAPVVGVFGIVWVLLAPSIRCFSDTEKKT